VETGSASANPDDNRYKDVTIVTPYDNPGAIQGERAYPPGATASAEKAMEKMVHLSLTHWLLFEEPGYECEVKGWAQKGVGKRSPSQLIASGRLSRRFNSIVSKI
jgi:hypothetical protein